MKSQLSEVSSQQITDSLARFVHLMKIEKVSQADGVRSLTLLIGLLAFMLCSGFTASFHDFDLVDDEFEPVYKYNRIAEIEQHWGALASSASRLDPDDCRAQMSKRELSFENGGFGAGSRWVAIDAI